MLFSKINMVDNQYKKHQNEQGRILKAIFNQSTEDYLLEKEAVALASNCQELENQLVISPDGFVIF